MWVIKFVMSLIVGFYEPMVKVNVGFLRQKNVKHTRFEYKIKSDNFALKNDFEISFELEVK